jgi:hypothetical protein
MTDPDDLYSDERLFAQFEAMGVPEVEHMTNQWSGRMRGAAFKWLYVKAQEERSRIDASFQKEITLSQQGNHIAKQARNAAIWALFVAIIAAVAAIVGDVR